MSKAKYARKLRRILVTHNEFRAGTSTWKTVTFNTNTNARQTSQVIHKFFTTSRPIAKYMHRYAALSFLLSNSKIVSWRQHGPMTIALWCHIRPITATEDNHCLSDPPIRDSRWQELQRCQQISFRASSYSHNLLTIVYADPVKAVLSTTCRGIKTTASGVSKTLYFNSNCRLISISDSFWFILVISTGTLS